MTMPFPFHHEILLLTHSACLNCVDLNVGAKNNFNFPCTCSALGGQYVGNNNML